MTPRERWLSATWPVVRARLPPAPARVVDVGCGSLGGFVPLLRSGGYDAIGIDPAAPNGSRYQRVEFEHAQLPQRVDAVIASTSLHHVADPTYVIDRIGGTLMPGGTFVVIEWAWERFDHRTARWCFSRLRENDEGGWLHRLRADWSASGTDWSRYLRDWAGRERLHRADALLRRLDERFHRRLLSFGPYFFADLDDVTEADEQAAIDAGEIRATRVDWVGTTEER